MEASYAVVLSYDGRRYFGWQRLKDKPTIQGSVETAVAEAFGEPVLVSGAGRTDRGAHAEGQVAGFRLTEARSPAEIVGGLNEHLPKEIRASSAKEVPSTFHARTSATGKTYEYRIITSKALPPELDGRALHVPSPLDIKAMEDALAPLVGKHDFASFATKPRFKQKITVREINRAEIESDQERVTIRFQANSFLNHMVRNMVRPLVKVGLGRLPTTELKEILRARSRKAAPGSSPAYGLYLMKVFYD